MYYVYMIKNGYDNLYIGVTDKPQRRLHEHNTQRGAHFTKFKSKFEIVFLEPWETLEQARTREVQLKKWSRSKKEMLIKLYSQNLLTKIEGA